jgi:hypothetical protein
MACEQMTGEIVKAEVIINHNPYLGSVGPKARIVTSMGQIWWAYQDAGGHIEMALMGQLSPREFVAEMEKDWS